MSLLAHETFMRGLNHYADRVRRRREIAWRALVQYRALRDLLPASDCREIVRRTTRSAPVHPLCAPAEYRDAMARSRRPIVRDDGPSSEYYSRCGWEDAQDYAREDAREYAKEIAALTLFVSVEVIPSNRRAGHALPDRRQVRQ